MSIRSKLALFTAVMATIAVLFCTLLTFSMAKTQILGSVLDANLDAFEDTSDVALSFLNHVPDISQQDPIVRRAAYRMAFQFQPRSRDLVLVEDGTPILNNTGIDAITILDAFGQETQGVPAIEHAQISLSGQDYLLLGQRRLFDTSIDVCMVTNISKTTNELSILAWKCLMLSICVIFACMVAARAGIAHMLQPLDALRHTVRSIAAGNHGARVSIRGTDEIAELAHDNNLMAEAIELRVAQLKKTSEDRRMLLSAVSHEMRTPVTAISALAHTLRHLHLQPEQQKQALQVLEDEALRLERLSGKLAQLFEPNERLQRIQVLPVSGADLAGNLQAATESQMDGIELELVVDGNVFYHLDHDLAVAMLSNLLDNSRKAEATAIKVHFAENEIRVQDNGCGIPASKLADVAKPFVTGDDSRSSGGFGLGLAIVQRIAEFHHAQLTIDSTEGTGTTVSLIFLTRV